jgi:hypothetical protein
MHFIIGEKLLTLSIITEGLPEELETQLLSKENVHYFSYISYQGGCLSSSNRKEYYWIALTNKRFLYKAKIKEENKVEERNGILPLEKISFIEVTDIKENSGCSTTLSYKLVIGTSGGNVEIPIPRKEKGYEIRKVYSEIAQGIGEKIIQEDVMK